LAFFVGQASACSRLKPAFLSDEFLGLREAMPAGLEAKKTLSAANGWSVRGGLKPTAG
jgi:hypothetical protein